MPAGNNNFVDTDAKIKDFLNAVLSSEGIVVDIRRTFINYNGVNRSRVFARRANEMASKGGNEKFVVIALMCYPALQWILQAQDIDRLVEELREQNPDESVSRMSNIQRVLESSLGGCKPQLRLEMRKVFFARCQQLVDAVDEAMNAAVFHNPKSKAGKISLAMALLRGSILETDPVTAVTIRTHFDSIIRKTNIPSIGGAFTVAGDTQEDTSFTAQASISPSTAIVADGTNWRLGASRVLIEDNDTRTAVTINSADSFQYDGKSLSFEKDGATYIVRAIADTYTGGVQYAEEKTSESYTSSGMRYIGNGHVLVVLGTCPTSKNADTAVNSVVSSVLESAVPASDDGNITVSGVPMNISNCQVSFTNNLALVKKDGFELRFIPSTYQSDAIAFGLVGTTSSGASVLHGDYASTDGTEVYLIESGTGNVMAFTNSKEFVTSVLGLQ